MTTLRRILVLLIAAAVVVGGTIALARTGVLSNLTIGRGGEGRPEFGEFRQFPQGDGARPVLPDGQQFEGRRGGEFRDGLGGEQGQGGFFGLGEIVKNLIIIGGTVAAVVAGSWAVDWIRRGRRAPA